VTLTAKQRRVLRRAFDEVAPSVCTSEGERRWFGRWIGRIATNSPCCFDQAMAVLEALAGGHLDGHEPGVWADRLLRAGEYGLPADAAVPAIRRAVAEGSRFRLDYEEISGRIILDLAHKSASIILRPDGTWRWIGQGARHKRSSDRDGLDRPDPPPGEAPPWPARLAGVDTTPHAP